jgi:hypothetical protein
MHVYACCPLHLSHYPYEINCLYFCFLRLWLLTFENMYIGIESRSIDIESRSIDIESRSVDVAVVGLHKRNKSLLPFLDFHFFCFIYVQEFII